MKTSLGRLSRLERKDRAARLIGPTIQALGLTWTEGALRLKVSYRALCMWRSSQKGSTRPAGKKLLRVEAFLRRALKTLQKRKVVRKSLEELVK